MKVLVGFDGSPDAATAITVGAALFPEAHAHVAYVWMPPFTVHSSPAQRRETRTVEGLIGLLVLNETQRLAGETTTDP